MDVNQARPREMSPFLLEYRQIQSTVGDSRRGPKPYRLSKALFRFVSYGCLGNLKRYMSRT